MPHKLIILIAVSLSAQMLASVTVATSGRSEPPPPPPPSEPSGPPVTIGSDVEVDDVNRSPGTSGGGGGAPRPAPTCRYTPVLANDIDIRPDAVSAEEATTRGEGDDVERLYRFDNCTDGRPEGYRYVPVNVDPAVVRTRARDNVTKLVPQPDLALNPGPELGTFMNLGMWLAITPPDSVTARAEVGFVWAETTATFTHMDWDMGNGDTVTCTGPGVAIQEVYRDPNDAPNDEEGPCGYTYGWPDKRGEKTVSVTAHWTITYSDSTGASGTLNPLSTTNTFDYHVYELLTIGIDN